MRLIQSLFLIILLSGCARLSQEQTQLNPFWMKGGGDCHMHVNPAGGEMVYNSDRAKLALEGSRLTFGCILSQGYQSPSNCKNCSQQSFTMQRNDWTLKQAEKHKELIPFCGIPLDFPWTSFEVRRCINKDARGFKLHPVSQKKSLLTPSVMASLTQVASQASAAKVPLLIHVDFDKKAEVEALFNLAKTKPDLTMIAAHQLGRNIAMMIKAPKNVMIEISGLVLVPAEQRSFFVNIWRQIGMERILLGSDWPLMHPSEHLIALEQLDLTPLERQQIVRDNFHRVF